MLLSLTVPHYYPGWRGKQFWGKIPIFSCAKEEFSFWASAAPETPGQCIPFLPPLWSLQDPTLQISFFSKYGGSSSFTPENGAHLLILCTISECRRKCQPPILQSFPWICSLFVSSMSDFHHFLFSSPFYTLIKCTDVILCSLIDTL